MNKYSVSVLRKKKKEELQRIPNGSKNSSGKTSY